MTRKERRYWRTQYIKLAVIIIAAVAAMAEKQASKEQDKPSEGKE